MPALPYRPLMTLACFLAVLLTLLLAVGCSTPGAQTSAHETTGDPISTFEQDRTAILGMAGEFIVSFEFRETLALRPGYELTEPYHAEATELVLVVTDEPKRIEMQHILVVTDEEGEQHIVKHWRQVWEYEQTERYHYTGHRTWQPTTITADAARGTWTQSVHQVSDEPRYWGTGTWVHANGVSTWTSDTTNRPLPRREASKRSDYHIVVATNTHIVTPTGWVHQQANAKLDLDNAATPVIALETGLNTYVRASKADFAQAREYWENTHAYWAQVRSVWGEVYAEGETVSLRSVVRGDAMHIHLFDLADEYWGDAECTDAQERIKAVIGEFRTGQAVAQP